MSNQTIQVKVNRYEVLNVKPVCWWLLLPRYNYLTKDDILTIDEIDNMNVLTGRSMQGKVIFENVGFNVLEDASKCFYYMVRI